jgi:glycosyltransferase involved in cell wall biosynthesis
VHDLTPLRFPELCTPDTLQYPTLLRRAARRGALFHTPTRAIGDELIDTLGIHPDQVAVVPLGLTPVGHGTIPQRLRDAIGDQFLLAVGTIEPRKDLPTLVADLRLVIAGPDGWGAAQLTTAVSKSRHRDRIIRTGAVDESTKSELLRSALVLVYPSIYEGFGLPPLEAMSVGTPVVTTEVPAITEVCADGVSAVPVGDPEAVAKAVDALLGNDDLRHLQIERGHEIVALYDWDRTVDALCQHMLKLAGEA